MTGFLILYSGITTGMVLLSLCTAIKRDRSGDKPGFIVAVQLLACTVVFFAAVSIAGVMQIALNLLTWVL